MIKANELRVGNYVYPNDENKTPYPVLGLVEEGFVCCWKDHMGNVSCVKYSNAEPIPLTREILEKCGFYYRGREVSNQYETHDPVMAIGEDYAYRVKWATETYGGEMVKSINFYCNHDFIRRIEYLHQLQNLYFALTGEELTVNL